MTGRWPRAPWAPVGGLRTRSCSLADAWTPAHLSSAWRQLLTPSASASQGREHPDTSVPQQVSRLNGRTAPGGIPSPAWA